MNDTTAVVVRLWRFQLDEMLQTNAEIMLSSDERARADRLKFPLVRQRFINGRVLLRQTLAAELKTEPAALKFEYTPTGKPYLAGTSLHFNFTHSENLALLAIATVPVGVDVERKHFRKEYQSMEPTIFTAEERELLNRLSGTERENLFFTLWTCKEALIKATGEGFQVMLRHQIRLDEKMVRAYVQDSNGSPIPWLLKPLDMDNAFSAAVAAGIEKDASSEIRIQHMNSSDG
jgi:4'-phosphopantetheinyl transferase